jgi:hypothetical protein
MHAENARLHVETTTRKGLTARSATKPRSSSSIDQWRTARPERNRLEKIQPAGPRMGSSSPTVRLQSPLDKSWGQRQQKQSSRRVEHALAARAGGLDSSHDQHRGRAKNWLAEQHLPHCDNSNRRRIRVESAQSVRNRTSTDNPEPLARNHIRK